MKVVMLVGNTCANDARVIREAEAAAAAGHTVVVIAETGPGVPTQEIKNGVTYKRFQLPWAERKEFAQRLLAEKAAATIEQRDFDRSQEPFFYKAKRYAVARAKYHAYRLPILIKSPVMRFVTPRLPRTVIMQNQFAKHYTSPGIAEKPDLVHAHDLLTLTSGAKIAEATGAKLIYDSHELETGRNARYSRLEKKLRANREKSLIVKTDAVITVSDSIADHLAKIYPIPRPIVILNAPDTETGAAEGDHVRQRIGLAANVPLALYVGSVTINRGIEFAVRALKHAPELHLATVGPMSNPVVRALRTEAEDLGVTDRLHFVDPVPHRQVTSFVRSADVSLVLIQDVCLSYRYCFPNKLLESIVAGVPVLAARLVELEKIISVTKAGLTVDQTDPKAIAAAAMEIARNRKRYEPSEDTIRMVQDTYSWPRQAEILRKLYNDLSARSA